MSLPEPVDKLIKQWSKLPGAGEKTARRMVFHLLKEDPDRIREFGEAIIALTKNIHRCSVCGAITDVAPCVVCTDRFRNQKVICVVESEEDCVAMEQSGIFGGVYHVLGGRVSPLDDDEIPEESIDRLRERGENGAVEESILATAPRIEGDLTAYALQDALKELPVKISRLSYGLPVGGSIGYADRVTLHMAMEARKEMS